MPTTPNPERRLRIGYVSPDFRDHVVGRNLIPLFRRHDRRDFEIFCYSGVTKPDKLTEEFRQRADHWRNTAGVADEAFAEMIRRDGVDILVDLSQHMAGNRLPMFARQPAPVQVSFAGYPESTGVEAIEYRISDRYPGERAPRMSQAGEGREPRLLDRQLLVLRSDVAWRWKSIRCRRSRKMPITFGCLGNALARSMSRPFLKLWGVACSGAGEGFAPAYLESCRMPPGANAGDPSERRRGSAPGGVRGVSAEAGIS